MIKRLAYELYKIDWKHNHMITADTEMDAVKDYFEGLVSSVNFEYTYEDYIEEFGYNGELYVSFEEFIKTEYLDDDYICGLLGSAKLIGMYYKDI